MAGQAYNLSNNEFCNAARVCEWRVKDSNAMSCGIIEVNLICSDTEATDNDEIFCLAENFLGKFSLRSYPKYMYISAIVFSNASAISS